MPAEDCRQQAGHGNDTEQACGDKPVKSAAEADFRKVGRSAVWLPMAEAGEPPGNVRACPHRYPVRTTIPAVEKDRRPLLVTLVLTIKGQQGLKVAGHEVSLYE